MTQATTTLTRAAPQVALVGKTVLCLFVTGRHATGHSSKPDLLQVTSSLSMTATFSLDEERQRDGRLHYRK